MAGKNKMLQDAEILIKSYNSLFKRGTDIYLKEAKKMRSDSGRTFIQDDKLENHLNNDLDEMFNEEFCTEGEYDLYLMENMGKKIISGSTQEIHKVFKYRDKLYEEWDVTPVQELGNITPEEYFSKIEDLDILIEIFKLYAVKSDYKMPDAFLKKLKVYGNECIDIIIKLAINEVPYYFKEMFNMSEIDYIPDKTREYFTVSLTAIEILGSWKIEEVIIPIIELLQNIPSVIYDVDSMDGFYNSKNDDIDGYMEMYRSNIRDALVSIGSSAIEHILNVFENIEEYDENHEYIAMALAEIGKENRSDRIYRTLKDAFLNMDNKIVGSSCLGIYGDCRAITALRGYVKKNLNNLDRETFYEIKKAVEDLGGNMDDIKFRGPAVDLNLH